MNGSSAFAHFVDSLASRQTVYETLDFIALWCSGLVRSQHSSIVLFAPPPAESVRTLARSSDERDGGIDHAVNTMAAGWVRANTTELWTDDVLIALGFDNPTERQKRIGPFMSVPLRTGEEMSGVLNLGRTRGSEQFSRAELQTILDIAPLAARFIDRARQVEQLALEHARLRSSSIALQHQHWVECATAAMQKVRERITRVAPSHATVLITGETGTGKELIAWAIHQQSPRASKPLVAVNCGAIPASLADAELFGHERGAFTGADVARPGKFELADGGTLFLDEISAMPLDLQPRLLRVLEDGRFSRIGSSKTLAADVRVIAASNTDLTALARQGSFRQDLYHRLNVFPIQVPPLRDRQDDIPILANAFLAELSAHRKRFSPEALETLRGMPWPGNVRELRNLVERISILCSSAVVSRNDVLQSAAGAAGPLSSDVPGLLKQVLLSMEGSPNLLLEAEKHLVQIALDEARGNITQAAHRLGISRVALHRRVKKLGIRVQS